MSHFDSILKAATSLGYFSLHAFVVMPNRVPMLITPTVPIRRISNGLKGSSARLANKILSRTNQPLRDCKEFAKIWAYIERNPGSARLVKRPEGWPWSCAGVKLARN